MMRIGIIGTRGIPNHYGGFEQAAQHLSEGLVARGHEVYVYNSHNHPFKEKSWNGVNIIHCYDPEFKYGTAGQFIYDRNCLDDAREKQLDILLHLGYTSDSVWWRKWPKKTVNIVNMDGMEWKRAKYNTVTRKFLKWAESIAAKKAQVLVADSRGIQEHLRATYRRSSVYIPYGTELFSNPDASWLKNYGLGEQQYYLVVARMEPENNIEMIIKGWLASNRVYPLFIVGNIGNKFGKYLVNKYDQPGILFSNPIYERVVLDNLRHYSKLYFHGHSSGGTNPSLLEAMACSCTIAAHQNIFNKAVLEKEAFYFSSVDDITSIINAIVDKEESANWKKINQERISTIYTHEKIVDAYEQVMLQALKNKATY